MIKALFESIPSSIDVCYYLNTTSYPVGCEVTDTILIEQVLQFSLAYYDVQQLYMKDAITYETLIIEKGFVKSKADFYCLFDLLNTKTNYQGSIDIIDQFCISAPTENWKTEVLIKLWEQKEPERFEFPKEDSLNEHYLH